MVDGEKPVTMGPVFHRLLGVDGSFNVLAGIKESVCWTPPPEVNPNKTCEYQALCSRFKDLLTLPGAPPPPHQSFPHRSKSISNFFSARRLLQRRREVQPVLLRVLLQAAWRRGLLQEGGAAARLRPALWLVPLCTPVRPLTLTADSRPMNDANVLKNVDLVCRLKPHCEVSNALKKWHIAYHGTSVGTLRRTLDHNQLLPGTETA